MSEITVIGVLSTVNLLTSAANVIIAFSLFVYIAVRNPRNAVARGFGALMFFVAIVYAGDVLLARARDPETTALWLRFQWIGIALVPAAYVHFSDALLRTTNLFSAWRRALTFAVYLIGLGFFLLAANTELLVRDQLYVAVAPQFAAGPYFWVFVLYFAATFGGGVLNTLWARHRCLTATSRRRITYLLISFAAPALGVFPYLLLAGTRASASPEMVLLLSLLGNSGIATMMVMMAYSVSYYGAIEPDRVVKRNLIRYLIQAPLMGTGAIGLILFVPRLEQLLNWPPDSLVIFAAIVSIVMFQVIVALAKPILDVVSDWEDRREVAWLQRLDERLLTRSDQMQLFENLLAAFCDILRAREGFVLATGPSTSSMRGGPSTSSGQSAAGAGGAAAMDARGLSGEGGGEEQRPGGLWGAARGAPDGAEGRLELEAFVGARATVQALVRDGDIESVVRAGRREFTALNGVWWRPLFAREGDGVLGVLGIASAQQPEALSDRERRVLAGLVHQIERTLEDRRLQTVIVGALQELRPEIESLQRVRSRTTYLGSTRGTPEAEKGVGSPEFPQWVREALTHYWGGPKLSESPLLDLKIVHEALDRHEQSPTQALRGVLLQAVEYLRPGGEPDLQAREWILYNILHMKFIEGRRIREIAERLAMSESDLYRKQRLAIDEVARTLVVMEQKAASNGNGAHVANGSKTATRLPE